MEIKFSNKFDDMEKNINNKLITLCQSIDSKIADIKNNIDTDILNIKNAQGSVASRCANNTKRLDAIENKANNNQLELDVIINGIPYVVDEDLLLIFKKICGVI